MPYLANGYTKYIYPLKMHDYLASGRPVVTARLRSVEDFGEVLTLVNQADEWPAAISDALAPAANTAQCRLTRQAVARQYDWNLLVEHMAKTIVSQLAPEYLDRLETSLGAKHVVNRLSL